MFSILTLYRMNMPGKTSLAYSPPSSQDSVTRLLSLDFLRVLACLTVMVIHVTSAFIYNDSGVTLWGMNPAFILNQAARFSVPLFLLLSGFSLGMGRPQPYGTFLKNRCRKVLLPYVLWVLVYEGYNVALAGFPRPDLQGFLAHLLTGQAAPHLYFIPLLFQFYLLYPLLKKWVDRNPAAAFLWSLAITLGIQGLHSLEGLGILSLPLTTWLLRTGVGWCFYFAAGMCLQKADLSRLPRPGIPVPLTLIFPGFALLYAAWASRTGLLDSMKPELMLYTLLVFLWGVTLWPAIQCRPVTTLVSFLSRHSMGIYFNHILILCLLRYVPRFSLGMSGMVMLFLGTLCLSVLTAWFLDRIKHCFSIS